MPGASATLSSPHPTQPFPADVAHRCFARSKFMRPVSHGTVLQFFGRPPFGWGMVRPPGIEPGSRTWQARVLPLNHGRVVDPPSGLAPEPAVYETAARTTRAAGEWAPAEGFEPPSSR